MITFWYPDAQHLIIRTHSHATCLNNGAAAQLQRPATSTRCSLSASIPSPPTTHRRPPPTAHILQSKHLPMLRRPPARPSHPSAHARSTSDAPAPRAPAGESPVPAPTSREPDVRQRRSSCAWDPSILSVSSAVQISALGDSKNYSCFLEGEFGDPGDSARGILPGFLDDILYVLKISCIFVPGEEIVIQDPIEGKRLFEVFCFQYIFLEFRRRENSSLQRRPDPFTFSGIIALVQSWLKVSLRSN